MIGETVAQVKGSKPRFRPAGKTNEITRQRVSELSEEYLEARNAKLRVQTLMAETEAAKTRGELIEKKLVERQAAFIFVSLRQAVLNFPIRYARQMVGLGNEHEAKQILTKAAHEFLSELASFPEKAIDPDWMKTLEADGQEDGKPLRPSSGQEIKAEAEKAKRRRRQKTETMRRLRAKG